MTAATPSPEAQAPTTDIEVEAIVLRACHFEDRLFGATFAPDSPTEEAEGLALGDDGATISPEVGIWLDERQRIAFVRLLVKVEPKRQPSWAASVEVVGKYSAGDNPVLPLEKFARNNGVAYLVPFVREKLASLTAASIFGAYLFPPLSVTKLHSLARQNMGGTTTTQADNENRGTSAGKLQPTAE